MGHNPTNKEFDSKFPEPDNNSSIFSKFLNGKMYDYTLRSLIHDVNLPVNHMGHNPTNKEFDSKFPEPDNNSWIFSKLLNGEVLTDKFDKNFRPVNPGRLVESCGQPQFL